jgi:hypothetical protein
VRADATAVLSKVRAEVRRQRSGGQCGARQTKLSTGCAIITRFLYSYAIQPTKMPNRYVREAAIQSEAVNSVDWQNEVFWRRLINRVDDFGRFTANHELLRASIFPLKLDRVRTTDIPRLLAVCEKAGLLYVYTVAGKQFLVMNQWEKGRAATSAYPEPPPDIIQRMQAFVYRRKQMHTDAPDSDSDSDTDANSDTDADNKAVAAEIEAIYNAYPRKKEPLRAKKAIEKALKTTPANRLLERTLQYAASTRHWSDHDKKYIPHPASWFNGGCYEEDPKEWVRTYTNKHQAPAPDYTKGFFGDEGKQTA